MTYSFPCQDLSSAGQGKGMQRGSGTRSGLLWQVERILLELTQRKERPDVLVTENVPQVCNEQNSKDFDEWLLSLERMGYVNYFKVLNAKDYGIPQNRERLFCVSILGQYGYSFPKEIKLRHSLKDFLDNDEAIAERYYLSDKMLKYMTTSSFPKFDRRKVFERSCKNVDDIGDNSDKVATISNTLTCLEGQRPCSTFIMSKGRMGLFSYENDDILIQDNGVSKCLLTTYGNGRGWWVERNARVRKLTPYECGKLMGFDRADFVRMREAGLAEATLYHSAGDSIVTTVLMGIFGKLLGYDDDEIGRRIEAIASMLASEKG